MKKIIAHFLLCITCNMLFAQNEEKDLTVVNDITIHQQQIKINPSLNMLELSQLIPHLQIELRYATKNNFTHVRMYPKHTNKTYLRKDAANALFSVAKELEAIGLGIKVWDAYRPYSVTKKFWELIYDERYVANPAKGSGHNRGSAIDMTLFNLKTGKEIDMPTGFDDFTEAAHHGYMKLEEKKIENRELLKRIMLKYGFNLFATEWWHYSWNNPSQYPVLDLPFNQLEQ